MWKPLRTAANSIRPRLLTYGAILALLLPLALAWAEVRNDLFDYPAIDYDQAAIQYSNGPTDDAVMRLQKEIDSGKTTLDYDSAHFGYLPSLLKHLGLNIDSQLLVLSKTSFQAPRISPKRPRALYFGDNAAVGYVQGGDVMEVAATDPKQGIVFYTLPLQKMAKPTFLRRTTECLNCHLIPATLGIPGLEVTSVIPAPDGTPAFPAGGLIVDGRTPLEDRWGGWYVTGTSGGIPHRGNSVARSSSHPGQLDTNGNQNVISLKDRFDTSAYLAPDSDIVALMTLDQQTRMVDLLIRMGWETRIAMQEGKLDDSRKRLEFVADQLVSYMTFAHEAKLFSPLVGTSTFTQTFPERGPRDKQGRSLRDFDLKTRLFKYPASYMIYSEAFDGLPEPAKQIIYQRLYDVLSGKDTSPDYAGITADRRKAALEIIRDTKTGLPDYWK